MSSNKNFDPRFKSCAKVAIAELARATPFLTQSQRAIAITQYAIDEGYIEPRPAVYGSHLTWEAKGKGKKTKPHWWLVKSAFDLILMHGWQPSNEHTWKCFFYYHMKKNGPFDSDQALMDSIPLSFKREEGVEFIDLVRDRMHISENTKPISCVVDMVGEAMTNYYSTSTRAISRFIEEHGFASFDEARQMGYEIKSVHVDRHNLDSEIEKMNRSIEVSSAA